MSFCINGLIFFFVGASSVNYLIRWGMGACGEEFRGGRWNRLP